MVLSKLKEVVVIIWVSVGFLVIEPWGCQEFRKVWGKSVEELGCSIAGGVVRVQLLSLHTQL